MRMQATSALPLCPQVLNVNVNTWTLMPEAYLQPMLTADAQGPYRQDNHAWLFAWSNGTLFQVCAGLSTPSHAPNVTGATWT